MKFLHKLVLIGQPSQDELLENLKRNSEQVIQILDEHVNNKSIRRIAKLIPEGKERFDYEWLINPFQYARQTIHNTNTEKFIDFAQYLNGSEVWADVSPHFYDSSAWTQVYQPILDYCSKEHVQRLANILNQKGALQECLKIDRCTPDDANRIWGIRL